MSEDNDIEGKEQEISVEQLVYPATASEDEQRRAYIIECLASAADLAAYDPNSLLKAINMLCEWVRTGELPPPKEDSGRKKPTLTPVKI